MINGIIYKYTSPSGKVYIGQTINEKKRRQNFLNINKAYAGTKINNARTKYGPNNFEYEVIFKVSSNIQEEVQQILNQKEIQYISLFDSFYNGYNSNEGGGTGAYERTEDNKVKMSYITKEYYKTHKSAVAKTVLQYSIYGDFIKEWESAKQASDFLNLQANDITVVCQNKRNQAGGFIWAYKTTEDYPLHIQIKSTKSTTLPVYQCDKDGNIINKWPTITEAANSLGYSLGNFSTYCNGRNNHEYKGYFYYRGTPPPLLPNDQAYKL